MSIEFPLQSGWINKGSPTKKQKRNSTGRCKMIMIMFMFRQRPVVDPGSQTLRHLQGQQLRRELPADPRQHLPTSLRGHQGS